MPLTNDCSQVSIYKFYLQHFNCYILRYNNLIAIYNLLYLHFLSPSLKAACFPKKIRLKKFAFSIYQQFPKMMSMDFYTRQASQTAHGDCKSRIKLPRNIRISPDRHRQFRVEPPVHNLNHPTACPTSATCARG